MDKEQARDPDDWKYDPLNLGWVKHDASIDVTALALAHPEVDVSADILGHGRHTGGLRALAGWVRGPCRSRLSALAGCREHAS